MVYIITSLRDIDKIIRKHPYIDRARCKRTVEQCLRVCGTGKGGVYIKQNYTGCSFCELEWFRQYAEYGEILSLDTTKIKYNKELN